LALLLIVFFMVEGFAKIVFSLTIRPLPNWGWVRIGLRDEQRRKDIVRRHRLDGNLLDRLEAGRALRTMPKMMDVRAGAVFRLVGGDQFFGAANATYSKRGTPIGNHRRHNNFSIPIPDRIAANTTFNSAASLFLSGGANSSLHCITERPKRIKVT
jgi:hypothetical protein